MAAFLLAPIAQLNTTLLTTIVHPSYYPFPLLSTLHAARVSLVHHALSKRASEGVKAGEKKQTTWAYDIAGFLIMAWGGALLTNFMLGQTPIQFLSILPFINYVSVHLFTTLLLSFLSTPAAKLMDTTLILIDGSLRTQAVIGSIGMATASSHPAVRSSLLMQVLLGTVGATGGGQLAGTLSIYSPLGWSLQTPPVLRANTIVEVIDVWMAFVCSLLYGITTLSHPSYVPTLAWLYNNSGKPLFTPLGARAACTLVFAAGFAYRAAKLHWLPATIVVEDTRKITPKVRSNGTKAVSKKQQ